MKKESKKSTKKQEKVTTNKELLGIHSVTLTGILKRELFYQICMVVQLLLNILMFVLIAKK